MTAHLFWENYRCCGRPCLLRVPFWAVMGEYRRRCRLCKRSWIISLTCTQLDPFRIDTIIWRETTAAGHLNAKKRPRSD